MKYKNYIQRRRLLNQLYIKLGMIKAGNDSIVLKNQVKNLIKKIKTL